MGAWEKNTILGQNLALGYDDGAKDWGSREGPSRSQGEEAAEAGGSLPLALPQIFLPDSSSGPCTPFQ